MLKDDTVHSHYWSISCFCYSFAFIEGKVGTIVFVVVVETNYKMCLLIKGSN